ncbi:MAG: class I SAM-dependent methyltransferase [Acetobacteraceae bacterium]|nr:class I SAM-dependent methyltransferase [Acetobacteraceae bacterium]
MASLIPALASPDATAPVMMEPDPSDLWSQRLAPLFWRPARLGAPSAWWGHVPFAHWLVGAARPRLIVELGTFTGVSYAAFCEAVARLRLDARCYAVDSWAGDPHGGHYGEEVLAELRRFHDARYAAFSELLRSTFDEALAHFADGTIDLLHIDGYHTYEAVRHDFEAWRPKLSERAVVLFHDTNVRQRDFGVWRLWAELRERHPGFEFLHGHGLGVLALGSAVPPAVAELCALRDPAAIAALRERFATLGERWILEQNQRDQEARAAELEVETRRLAEAAAEAERRHAAAQSHSDELERAVAETAARAAEEARARAAAESRAAAATAETARLRSRVERADAEVERLRAELKRAADESEQLHAEAERLRAELGRTQARAEHAAREMQAVLTSTVWQATWPVRRAASRLPPEVRRKFGAAARLAWWTLTLQLLSRRREHRRVLARARLVASSPLFDAEWYRRRYPDVAASGVDPALHYVLHGGAEHRNPGPAFDARWYLERHPDLAAAGVNPLLHYLEHGAAEGREIRPVSPETEPPLPSGLVPGPLPGPAPEEAPPPEVIEQQSRQLGLHLPAGTAAGTTEIAVGIVTYETPARDLRRAISSAVVTLARAGARTEGRVLLLDNGSPTEAITAGDTAVRRLPSMGNVGFGAGHNALMREAFASGAELYVAMNPDGALHPDALEAIRRMVRASDDAALVEAIQFPEEHPKTYDPVTFDTPWASGACLAIPRRIYEAIGGFDKAFLMYCEDVDLSWRARAAGFAVRICPRALFLHAVTNRVPGDGTRAMMLRSGLVLARKWGAPATFATALAVELGRIGHAPPADPDVAEMPAERRWVADFDHMLHFAQARW